MAQINSTLAISKESVVSIAIMQTVSQTTSFDYRKMSQASCKSFVRVYVCVTHSLRLCNSSLETMFMKRLIVLTALATLLGSASGCSMLNRSNVQSCETCDPTPPSSSLLSKLRMPRISLPWRRADELSGGGECNSCNEGFSEVGYAEGGIVSGEVYEGGGYYGGSVVSSESLYHPDAVYSGPTVIHSSPSSTAIPGSTTTKYAGELLPTPISPELGSVQ